jgi:oxygen-dependent protoporphyrinogen oxidase
VIVGAGLSGLAAGFDLKRGGADVLVLEAASRAGGVVGTIERDGFRFETGPNTVPASSEGFRRLCGDLGIAGRLIATTSTSDERYLYLRGRLRKLPSTPPAFLASSVLSLAGRWRAATEAFRPFRVPPPGAAEPTMAEFVSERLGEEAARVLAGAFVRGVYAAELGELGARSAFPRMWNACVEHGGLVRGMFALRRRATPDLPGPAVPKSALLSFPGGLQELVAALSSALGNRLRTDTLVQSIARSPEGWLVNVRGSEPLEATDLVLAVPARIAGELLAPCGSPSLSFETLDRVRHADVTLVHLGLARADVPGLPRGFGFLVPPSESATDPSRARDPASGGSLRMLGTIFASNLFPGRAQEGFAAVSSFHASRDLEGLDDPGRVAVACEDLARALGLAHPPRPRVGVVQRWKDVIPRYEPGHATRMEELERQTRQHLPGLHLAGSYVAGVSVDQVIARGRAVAREILA